MPAKPQWLLRVPEILEDLGALDTTVLDRPVIEKLFGVQRRQAINLLSHFGGYQTGKTFLIGREQLISRLEEIHAGEDYRFERERRVRLLEDLERHQKLARGRKVRIATAPDVHSRAMKDLPAGIHLKPGELRIEFFGTEDLLRHLYELSQAIVNDYGRFQKAVEE